MHLFLLQYDFTSSVIDAVVTFIVGVIVVTATVAVGVAAAAAVAAVAAAVAADTTRAAVTAATGFWSYDAAVADRVDLVIVALVVVVVAVVVLLQEGVPFEPDDLQGRDVAESGRKLFELVVLKQNRLKRARNSRL